MDRYIVMQLSLDFMALDKEYNWGTPINFQYYYIL